MPTKTRATASVDLANLLENNRLTVIARRFNTPKHGWLVFHGSLPIQDTDEWLYATAEDIFAHLGLGFGDLKDIFFIDRDDEQQKLGMLGHGNGRQWGLLAKALGVDLEVYFQPDGRHHYIIPYWHAFPDGSYQNIRPEN